VAPTDQTPRGSSVASSLARIQEENSPDFPLSTSPTNYRLDSVAQLSDNLQNTSLNAGAGSYPSSNGNVHYLGFKESSNSVLLKY
jgi:hypothetical protein